MFILRIIQKIKRKLFPFYKSRDLRFVFNKLEEGTHNHIKTAMFVGGCVRKYLSDEVIDDIDMATVLTTDQIKEKFKNTKFRIIDSGIKHGTVTLVSNELKLELTTLRKDVKTDGRHAEIEYTDDWHEDSKRRDFTINAIYLAKDGTLYDPQLGLADLKNCRVKFIGNPQKRIEEDYLRIIRFVRFSLEYKSETEKNTIKSVKLNLNGIKKISKERILTELFKILDTKNFIKLYDNEPLKEIFLLIFPEFKYLKRLKKLNKIFDQPNLNKKILLAILLIDDTNNYEYFSHKYNISNSLKDNLNLLGKNFLNINLNKNFFSTDLKKNIFYFGKNHLKELNLLHLLSDKKINNEDYFNILNDIKKTSLPKFPFDGNYLKNKGLKEGKVMGKTLKLLENEWVNNSFKISNKRILDIINIQKD